MLCGAAMVCVIVRNHRGSLDSADQGAGLARDPVHHHGGQAIQVENLRFENDHF